MPTSLRLASVLGALAVSWAGAVPIGAQGPAGAPDPARLPGRPGLPGAAAPGVPGPAAPTTASPSAPSTSDPGTAAISGVVTAADSGLPVRRARVMLRGRENPQGQVTLTDADGAFSFRGLTAGRYTLVAGKARYVDTVYRARRPGSGGRSLDLVPGQTLDAVALTLATAGVITGRVLDDAGEPVVGAHVAPMRYQAMPGGRRLIPIGHERTTDDTGTYRLFGLNPGRYYVAARAEENLQFGGEVVGPGVTGLAPTFHPSTPVPSEAQPIVVTAGSEVTADVTLVATTLAKVSGTVVDAGGRLPVGGFAYLMLERGAGPMSSSGGSPIGKGGAFTMFGVAPGDYVLNVRAIFEEGEMTAIARSGRGENPGFGVPISVGAGGMTDLRVVVPPVVEINGRVVLDGGQGDGSRSPAVMAEPALAGLRDSARAEVGADGRFVLKIRPGAWRFWTAGQGSMTKRMEFRGRDVEPGQPVEVTAEPGARLDITLTTQLTRVTGIVIDGSRQPVLDYRLIVFPRDEEIAERSFDRMRIQAGGADGRFEITALPPGDYLAVALSDFDPNEGFDPEVLDTYREAATPIRIAHGDPQTITLTLAAVP